MLIDLFQTSVVARENRAAKTLTHDAVAMESRDQSVDEHASGKSETGGFAHMLAQELTKK